MNPKDKAFLGKFFVKEYILIGLKFFGTREFSIMDSLGCSFPHQLKNNKVFTH